MRKKIGIFAMLALVFILILSIGIYLNRSYAPNDSDAAVGENWWNSQWGFRTEITVGANGTSRKDKPAEVILNFTQELSSLGKSGEFDPDSIRVVEISSQGAITDENVPFQFDKDSDYNAAGKASGKLIILLKEDTASSEERKYHVYFDLVGEDFELPVYEGYLEATDNVAHKGQASIKITTVNGEYYYHKDGGGFATLIDEDDKDWISWNTSAAYAGQYRGIPNMVHPQDGGFFHPGKDTSTTTLVSSGPLKATFRSISTGNEWETLWEIYPRYANMSLIKAPSSKKYWFLYEGTPGGTLEKGSDRITKSDGTSILASGEWNNDIPEEEWVFASDGVLDRSLYLIHHQDDSFVDGYYTDEDGRMTIFGFARLNNNRWLTGLNNKFTFGLANTKVFNQVREVVYNDYKELSVNKGISEEAPDITATPSTGVTNTPTETPGFSPTPTIVMTPSVSPTPTAGPISSPTATSIVTASATPLFSPTPTITVTPRVTLLFSPTPTMNVISTPTPTGVIVTTPTYSPHACGGADVNADHKFDLTDFVEFATAYQDGNRLCDDQNVYYGTCGGRDVDRNGKLDIVDFGGEDGFASRYFPKESCVLNP